MESKILTQSDCYFKKTFIFTNILVINVSDFKISDSLFYFRKTLSLKKKYESFHFICLFVCSFFILMSRLTIKQCHGAIFWTNLYTHFRVVHFRIFRFLLIVRSHQTEIIIVKRLIQGRSFLCLIAILDFFLRVTMLKFCGPGRCTCTS